MDLIIGKEYDRLEVAHEFGFDDDRQSMRGGIFLRNDKVLLIKTEDKQNYDDHWDPQNIGNLTYFASTKGIHKNKGDSIIDLPIDSGANKEFRDGTCPIILFCRYGDSYRYMGEFERTDSKPVHMIRNRYYVPGFQIISKNPDLISPYINEYLDNANANEHWTSSQIKAFSHMYFQGEMSLEDYRDIAISLDKPVATIKDAISSLNDGPSSMPKEAIASIKKAILIRDEEYERSCFGYDVKISRKVRVNQAVFRHNLDKIFKNKCCLTGINRREALVASHVLPWSLSDPYQKIDPNNGLLLNTFHDALFDKHLMTVRADGTVDYLDGLEKSLGELAYGRMCSPYTKISFPEEYHPSKEAFDHHNKIFDELNDIESRS